MRSFVSLFFLFSILLFTSCTSLFGDMKVVTAEGMVIRYANIQVVYESMRSKSERAQKIIVQKKEVYGRMETIQQALILDNGNKKALIEEMSNLRKRYDSLLEEEAKIKEEIYKKIDKALSSLAKESGIDFIFNMGEGVVFGAAKYDVTEDLLREIIKIDRRSDPSLR